jgi:hypothetical protein
VLTVRILYRASTISLQAAVHPEHTLGALNTKEEERRIQTIQLLDIFDGHTKNFQ